MPPRTYRTRRLCNRSLMFAAWRQAFDTLRRPPSPSSFQQLRELTERMREGTDLQMPRLVHAGSARPPPPPRRGAPVIHDWPTIKRLDADYCRTYCMQYGRPPRWKERWTALNLRLGNATPHIKTLQARLPKLCS